MAKENIHNSSALGRSGGASVKKPGGAPPEIITHKIEVRPYNRTEQDIPNWRRAVQNAESQIPRRSLLYSLYADVDLDGHVEAVTGKRRDPVKSAKWQFVDKEGKPIDAINEVIDSIGFDDLLEEIINSKFWGYSILEPRFWKDQDGAWEMEAGLIHRLNYRPENGIVAYTSHGDDGIAIREGIYAKTVMEVGKVKDLGLYMKAAPYAILKRGGLGDYAAFVQTFGNPLIDATWDGFDEQQRIKLNEALKEIGAGGTIIRPDGTSIEIKENNANATGDAHGSFLRFLNNEIAKSLLGTTETTESSSSSGYAQSETHQDQDDKKHDNDLEFVRKVLNSRFIRILQAYGFETKGGRFVIQEEERDLTKLESFEIYKGLAQEMNLPVDDDFWYETYGIPKPDNYDQIKKAQENPEPEKPKEDPKQEEPKKKEPETEEPEVDLSEKSWWLKLYERFFVKAPAETTGACGAHHTIKLAEADSFDEDGLLKRVYDAKGKLTFDAESFQLTANALINGFKEGWEDPLINLADAPGFTYADDDPAMMTAFEQNLFRFSGGKTLWEAQLLNSIFRRSKSFGEFQNLGKRFLDRSRKDYLETEYNSAMLTGQSASTYYRLIAQAETFPNWKYTTVGDNLVRKEHQALDDIILPVSDPIWDKLFPPNGWNCRCYIVPRMKHEVTEDEIKKGRVKAKAYVDSPKFERETKSGWGVNRAKKQFVFAENQRYVKSRSKDPDVKLSSLGPEDFNLATYEQMKARATGNLPVNEEEANNFYNSLEELEGEKVIRDYHNRPVKVAKDDFDRHSTNDKKKRAHRTKLLKALQEGLLKADEVWMKEEKLTAYTYIKYYKDVAVQINVKLINGKLKLVSWFDITEKPGIINKARSGLYIK